MAGVLRVDARRCLPVSQTLHQAQAGVRTKVPSGTSPALSIVIGRTVLSRGCLHYVCCCRGYINLYSLYIAWLASAIFIHMPSFESLGLDVRADVSTLLVTFVVTLGVLGVLHGAHALLFSATNDNAMADIAEASPC